MPENANSAGKGASGSSGAGSMSIPELRLVLRADSQTPGRWYVQVQKAANAADEGFKGPVTATFTRAMLNDLRAALWPNSNRLMEIGRAVWASTLNQGAATALENSLRSAQEKNLPLRIVIMTEGDEPTAPPLPPPPFVYLAEVPFEALYSEPTSFLARLGPSPVSRTMQYRTDMPATSVGLPLRVLLVVATPTDKPPANAAQEVAAIRGALQELIDTGAVKLEVCDPPTRAQLRQRLPEGFQIVHFICHGDFATGGGDPTPRPYLCLELPSRKHDPVTSDMLYDLFRGSTARLVVMTACQSSAGTPGSGVATPANVGPAAPIPAAGLPLPPELGGEAPGGGQVPAGGAPAGGGEPPGGGAAAGGGPAGGDALPSALYSPRAYDGLAQSLMRSYSQVAAVVAMQFDLETPAAVAFSGKFYHSLVQPGKALDEAVVEARQAIIDALPYGDAHRAWITPTLYWRCHECRPFTLDAITAQAGGPAPELPAQPDAGIAPTGGLTPEVRKQLDEIEVLIGFFQSKLRQIAEMPPPMRDQHALIRAEYEQQVNQLQVQRGALLGDSLRLYGGVATAGSVFVSRLTLRLRQPARVDRLELQVEFDPNLLSFTSASPGIEVRSDSAAALRVSIAAPSQGEVWDATEHDLGTLQFAVSGGAGEVITNLRITELQVQTPVAGIGSRLATLDAVVFLHAAAATATGPPLPAPSPAIPAAA